MTSAHEKPKANQTRLANRWGCSDGHAFRNIYLSSRLDTHPRPSGASTRKAQANETRALLAGAVAMVYRRVGVRSGRVWVAGVSGLTEPRSSPRVPGW